MFTWVLVLIVGAIFNAICWCVLVGGGLCLFDRFDAVVGFVWLGVLV